MEEDLEINDLVIRKKKYSYIILIVVFVVSVVVSNTYFNKLKASEIISSGDEIITSGEEVINEFSGDNLTENSGELLSDISENDGQENAGEEIIISSNSSRVIDPDKPMVALTFDDGPDPKRTLKMIEILKKYDAVATFFDIGNLMEKYPEIVQQELAAGCDVGGHTYSHVNLNAISKEEAAQEVKNVEKAFYNATGEKLKYLRPTYGNANAGVREVTDIPIINWCVDARDWESRNADKVIETITETKNFDGRIILMHVIYDSTLEAVDRLIPMLQKEGYQIVTITEMAEAKGYNMQNGKIYYQF